MVLCSFEYSSRVCSSKPQIIISEWGRKEVQVLDSIEFLSQLLKPSALKLLGLPNLLGLFGPH